MKLGPVHVVTDRTMAIMQRMIGELARSLDQANADRRHLAASLTTKGEEFGIGEHLHCPAYARLAPSFVLDADEDSPRSREAVARVIRAYQMATRNYLAPSRGMWDVLEARNADFVGALRDGNERTVGCHLRRIFSTDAVWGLGYLAEAIPASLRAQPAGNIYQLRVTDLLVALAEAVAVLPITNPEQALDGHIHALDVDLATVLRAVEMATGLDLSLPEVGAGYGCVIGGKRISPDTLVHGYTVHRLREIGATADDRVAELGGGFGCLAYQLFRAGFNNVSIYDLPWVNAIQGYFLIMALPDGSVRLHGEREGRLAVEPSTAFGRESADWVINTNSLPEIGAETAKAYIRAISRTVRKGFLSINMEAKPSVMGFEPQNSVPEMVAEVGGLRRASRCRYWLRSGYVEEVYTPTG